MPTLGTSALRGLRAAALAVAILGTAHAAAQSGGQSQVLQRYYQSILGRASDAGGLAFWLGEASRMTAEGVDPAEALRVVAILFQSSSEFSARGLNDAAYVDNLYATYFDRSADNAGRAYWLGQLAAGLPRDMVLYSFIFSAEFSAYMATTAGSAASRGEVYPVIDFYRGLLGRLPDNAGLRSWLAAFRSAQCQPQASRAAAVRQAAGDIAGLFFASAESAARSRDDRQFIGDLYSAFLRRGADASGFDFWVKALQQGTYTRSQVLGFFLASAEFTSRVDAVVQAGCVRLAAPNVANPAATTIASVAYASSSKLSVSWSPSSEVAASSYKVSAIDAVAGESSSVASTTTSALLTGLKANTSYSISVSPCIAFAGATVCLDSPVSSVVAQTPSEVWQMQGTGNTVAGLTPIVADGNVRISATRFGSDAPAEVAGRVQLYYGPMSTNQMLAVGVAAAAANPAAPSTYLNFTSLAASSGIKSPPGATARVKTINTGQGVPLSASMGGRIRLFFEATGADAKTRILSLDSVDGYIGRDFNASSATQCTTTAEYETGGSCETSVAVGVEGDAVNANSKILNARQNKVGWPTQDDWRWNGTPGTFMVFTSGAIAGCAVADRTHGYAVWDGTRWVVQYEANGCPKLFSYVQAMLPMHIGGVRYKMYYGDTSNLAGALNSQLPFLGPKRLIYANGARTGDPAVVDFEDWEPPTAGRDVVFLWPSGSRLDATAEGYIDDFHFLAPTANLDLQVAYLAVTDGLRIPIAVAAVLVNP